ncbi:coiled-coil domain-containing protein 130 homolog [Bacillus rossius redtenbacheri]|uniref:coiled-coil domain-containing protein 130 homolog n=1 Tax=Bacillus rossius redtenbacheri TaxID=93214 RepID=UPI002FDEDCC9
MGERKGTNLYYPPDYNPKVGGLNKFMGTHALRERARKLHLGILIIRFEMPYNIWCDGCGNHIGMGVRYNAEKKKVGMYYSTPVYQFRMKCHLCNNHFEIKTDPANLDYVIVSGARRQENRWDPTQNEQVVPETKQTSRRLFDDAMFKLEHGEGDKGQAKKVAPALGRLASLRDSIWRDDYAANCALRKKFRECKSEMTAKEDRDAAVRARTSLDIPLLPEDDEDSKMASLLSLKPAQSIAERMNQTRQEIIHRPALHSCTGVSSAFLGVRAMKQLSESSLSRDSLGITVRGDTHQQTTTTTAAAEKNSLVSQDYDSSSSDGNS